MPSTRQPSRNGFQIGISAVVSHVQLSSNADFVGAIYAPKITYSLGSNFDVYGSIICGRLTLASNGEIHFDEALLYDGEGEPEYDVRLWHELPPLPEE